VSETGHEATLLGERFAFDQALVAAYRTEMFNPFDPDHGFSDYFEAAATRNITLLRGFEELAEGVDSRGVLPRTDGPQSRLATGVSPADD